MACRRACRRGISKGGIRQTALPMDAECASTDSFSRWRTGANDPLLSFRCAESRHSDRSRKPSVNVRDVRVQYYKARGDVTAH